MGPFLFVRLDTIVCHSGLDPESSLFTLIPAMVGVKLSAEFIY
jgi:hypothetical protein